MRNAIELALLFQVVLYVVHYVRQWVGDAGLMATGFVLGLTDVDALTLSMTRSVATGIGRRGPVAVTDRRLPGFTRRMTAVMLQLRLIRYRESHARPTKEDAHMRSRITVGSLVLFACITAVAVSQSTADTTVKWAPVNLTSSTMIAGSFVSGPVIFVHDDAKMAAGEPCTSVHRFIPGKGVGEELVAFHCKPRWGQAPERFTQAVTTTPEGLRVMTEYQFAGDTEAHAIPKTSR